MVTIKAHFDGRVLVPEQPLDFPVGTELKIHVKEVNGSQRDSDDVADAPLAELVNILSKLPDDPDTPTDLAAQHDHYLHGMPKRL